MLPQPSYAAGYIRTAVAIAISAAILAFLTGCTITDDQDITRTGAAQTAPAEKLTEDQRLTAGIAAVWAEYEWLQARAAKLPATVPLCGIHLTGNGSWEWHWVYQISGVDQRGLSQPLGPTDAHQANSDAFRAAAQAMPRSGQTVATPHPDSGRHPTVVAQNRRAQEKFIQQAKHHVDVILSQALADLQASYDERIAAAKKANTQALADAIESSTPDASYAALKDEILNRIENETGHCPYDTAPPPSPTPKGPLVISVPQTIAHRTGLQGEFLALCQPGGTVYVNHNQTDTAYAIRLYSDEVVTVSRCDLHRHHPPAPP